MNHNARSFRSRRWLWAAVALVGLGLQGCERSDHASATPAAVATAPAPAPRPAHADFAAVAHAADVARVADWVVASNDSHGQPFAVIDKREARLFVFRDDGQLAGSAPILLGAAKGDDTVPGIGDRPIADVKPSERTTAAGRFVAAHGTNMRHESIIWIDYDAALSMHPVLTTEPAEHRLERLNSPDPQDHRISWGCVNVPAPFFGSVVLATLNVPHPVVYILPETRPLEAVFAGLRGAAAPSPVAAAGKGAATHL